MVFEFSGNKLRKTYFEIVLIIWFEGLCYKIFHDQNECIAHLKFQLLQSLEFHNTLRNVKILFSFRKSNQIIFNSFEKTYKI